MSLVDRIHRVTRQYSPELPLPTVVCSWSFVRQVPDGFLYQCTACGTTVVIDELLGNAPKRICSAEVR